MPLSVCAHHSRCLHGLGDGFYDTLQRAHRFMGKSYHAGPGYLHAKGVQHKLAGARQGHKLLLVQVHAHRFEARAVLRCSGDMVWKLTRVDCSAAAHQAHALVPGHLHAQHGQVEHLAPLDALVILLLQGLSANAALGGAKVLLERIDLLALAQGIALVADGCANGALASYAQAIGLGSWCFGQAIAGGRFAGVAAGFAQSRACSSSACCCSAVVCAVSVKIITRCCAFSSKSWT